MPINTAAWLPSEKATPLEIKESPYRSPTANEILIKTHAIALNPVDWAIQARGNDLLSWVTYPTILGSDVAGEVVEVGTEASSQFKIGDRVVGLAVGLSTNNSTARAFQTYVVLQTNIASSIPDTMAYEDAAVLPLGLCTAASGLFQKEYLALQHPTVPPKSTGKTLLVWGGSSSVGSNAIQLAVAGGYEVITTCSPKNFEYVKSIGASQAFDYSSSTITADLITATKNKVLAGAYDTIGPKINGAFKAIADVLLANEGGKFIASAMHPPKDVPEGITTKFIFGSTLKDNEVGEAVWRKFLPEALKVGAYKAMPEKLVVGKGLEKIQEGLDLLRGGVSARKVVVSL